jgi:hypothetical protein
MRLGRPADKGEPMRIHRLTKAQWLGKTPGKQHDGGGLYVLRSSPTAACAYGRLKVKGQKGYALRGHGSVFDESTIEEIREQHAADRKRARAGIDPVEYSKVEAEKAKTEAAATAMTVRKAAEAYHALNKRKWRSHKYRAQWLNRLKRHLFPKIGDKPCVTSPRSTCSRCSNRSGSRYATSPTTCAVSLRK